MKKFLVALLTLCLCLTITIPIFIVSATETEITEDFSWYSTDKTEFEISTPAEFLGLSYVFAVYQENFKNKTIKLKNNIILNSGEAENWETSGPVNIFTPLGTTALPFEGTFDGQGHSISGLYIISTGNDVGLFNFAKGATFKNFSIINSYYSAAERVGSVVGRIRDVGCTFENIYSEAIIKGNYQLGGLVGTILNYAEGSTFEKCVFAGKITGKQKIGGIIGDDSGAFNLNDRPNTVLTTFSNCANYGTLGRYA